jgi:hypothetical protein
VTVAHAINDDRFARRYAGRPNPGTRPVQKGINRRSFKDFRGISALARVALGCEVRNLGRDMLIGLLVVRPLDTKALVNTFRARCFVPDEPARRKGDMPTSRRLSIVLTSLSVNDWCCSVQGAPDFTQRRIF